MRALGLCLWKEWREFRAVAIGILVAVPLLLAISGFVIPSKSFADPNVGRGFTLLGALGALGMTLFALTTDLFAGEVRRGRIPFLDRLPVGLRASFFAKALVFLIGTSGAFFYGFAVASLITDWRGGSAPLTEFLWKKEFWPSVHYVLQPQVLIGAIAVWGVFPIACMAPRGVLTLPLAALVLGGLAVGVLGAMEYTGVPFPEMRNAFRSWGMQAFLFVAVLGTAYLAFVRGYRAGGGWPRAMRAGVVLLVLTAIVPLAPSARAALIVGGWIEGDSRIAMAHLSRDGNSVYLFRYSHISERKLVGIYGRRVDLRTGQFEALEGKAVMPPVQGWTGQQPARWPYIRVNRTLIDTDTGAAANVDEATATLESMRAATPLRTGDGRKLWLRGTEAVIENADGTLEVCATDLPLGGYPSGCGVRFFKRGALDATRMKFFETEAQYVYLRPGKWLAMKRAGSGPMMLVDPATNDWEEARGIAKGDRIAALHDDGRVFVERRETKALVLLDPETGVEEPVLDSEGSPVQVQTGAMGFRDAARYGRCAARTPSGARVFMLNGVPARYDADSGRLVRAKIGGGESMFLIGCASEDVLYVLVGERRIERLELGTSNRTVIYSEE